MSAYQASGGEFEEQAGHHRAEQLSDPVEDTAQEGDVAAEKGSERHRRVNVSAGDVGADGHGHEQAECMG